MVQLQGMRWQASRLWWHGYSGCDVIEWCDIIKSGCDVIGSSHDIIHIVAVYSYIKWGCMIDNLGVMTDRVDVLSDIIGVRCDIIALMSWVECCALINRGWDVIYSAYFAVYTVDVMSEIEWVFYHRYNGCNHTDTDMSCVMSYIVVVLS